MKTTKLFLGIGILSFIIFTYACQKDENPIFTDLVSQYELDKAIVQVNTTNASTSLQSIFNIMISDSTDRAHLCQAFVDSARFFKDNSGYFFIETYKAWVVAIVNHSLIGTNRMNIQDIYDKYFVRDLANTAKNIGYGFVEYYRENPTNKKTERKLSYVQGMPLVEWFIGAGFYGDPPKNYYKQNEANKIIVKEVTKTMAKGIGNILVRLYSDKVDQITFCQNFINYNRFFDNQSGYFFIYDLNGMNLAHGIQKNLEGKNLWDYQDTRDNYVIRDMVNIVKTQREGYYQYYWNNPVTGKEEPKTSYVTRIPGTDYFIGSGIYVEN
jgi:signal transduction histidine kinase